MKDLTFFLIRMLFNIFITIIINVFKILLDKIKVNHNIKINFDILIKGKQPWHNLRTTVLVYEYKNKICCERLWQVKSFL